MTKEDLKVMDGVITTLVILKPRLVEPYYSDVEYCIKSLKEIKQNEENHDKGNSD